VIVAPLVAWSVWKKEINLIYGEGHPVTEVRGRRLEGDDSLTRPGIYLLNPELVNDRWSEWVGCGLDFVILDEAHLYTNKQTKRHQGAQNLAAQARKRLALTGTPVLRHLVDLYGILRCIVPGAFGSFHEFALALGAKTGTHGLEIGSVPKESREWLDRRLSEVAVKLRWEDVATVPPITRERLPIKLLPADAQEYKRLAGNLRAIIGSRVPYKALLDAAKLLEVTTLRRFIGKAKIPAVVDLVRSANEPVVVWTWHKDVAHSIASALKGKGITAEVVCGDDPQAERDSRIVRFQAGEYDVPVCTIGAAGVGVDLTRARIGIIAEPPWLPGEAAQAEARYFRSGQTRPCITCWPVVAGTIEDRIVAVLMAKEVYADSRVLDGIASCTASHDAVLDSLVDLIDEVIA
jgi:SNF2 family DNA or RNA helicase